MPGEADGKRTDSPARRLVFDELLAHLNGLSGAGTAAAYCVSGNELNQRLILLVAVSTYCPWVRHRADVFGNVVPGKLTFPLSFSPSSLGTQSQYEVGAVPAWGNTDL